MKEKILEAFKNLGFVLEEIEDFGFDFQYEGQHYLYMNNNGDDNYLCITHPVILEDDEGSDLEIYQVMDKINRTLKYVKANILRESIWLSYERELFGDEDLKPILYSMIHRMDAGLSFLYKTIAETDEDNDTVSNGTDNDIDTNSNEDVA